MCLVAVDLLGGGAGDNKDEVGVDYDVKVVAVDVDADRLAGEIWHAEVTEVLVHPDYPPRHRSCPAASPSDGCSELATGPNQELRYWTGSVWSEHVADAGSAAIDALVA